MELEKPLKSHLPNPHTLLSVSLRRTTFGQPILPLAAPIMHPDSLLRLWCYINPLLT